MTIDEVLMSVRYVIGSDGKKTDVLIPLATWEKLLASWKKLIELLDDQEDNAILHEWLEKRGAGEVEMIPLDTLEQELIEDELLPG